MRQRALGILMLLVAVPAEAADLAGFQTTTWGMTEQEVQAIYGGRLTRWSEAHTSPVKSIPSRPFHFFGLRHYDVNGCDFNVKFDFENDKLKKVSLSLNNTRQLECGIAIANVLTSKYGLPSRDEQPYGKYSRDRDRAWFLDRTLI